VKYAEDFPVGVRRELGSTTLAEDDVIRFAREFDPQPFHVDKAAAEQGFYGGIIASGWHTCSLTMRIMVDNYLSDAAALGSPGIDELRWLKPVRSADGVQHGARGQELDEQTGSRRPDDGNRSREPSGRRRAHDARQDDDAAPAGDGALNVPIGELVQMANPEGRPSGRLRPSGR
jgi:acyl dehydratase